MFRDFDETVIQNSAKGEPLYEVDNFEGFERMMQDPYERSKFEHPETELYYLDRKTGAPIPTWLSEISEKATWETPRFVFSIPGTDTDLPLFLDTPDKEAVYILPDGFYIPHVEKLDWEDLEKLPRPARILYCYSHM